MWRDGDRPAFADAHAQKTTVHPGDESTQTHLADKGLAPVMTEEQNKQTNKQKESEKSTQLLVQLRICLRFDIFLKNILQIISCM